MRQGLAAFDMDGTLLRGRLVFALARTTGSEKPLKQIQASRAPGYEKTRKIASLFAGMAEDDLLSAIESIPFAKNAELLISRLKSAGFKTGIISDSYTLAAKHVARILDMDFVAANEIEFVDGRATGKVVMPMGWEEIGCDCKLSVCKRYQLERFSNEYGRAMSDTIAVGDTKSDVCMVRRAAIGIAFMPKDKVLPRFAKFIVQTGDFAEVLDALDIPLAGRLAASN